MPPEVHSLQTVAIGLWLPNRIDLWYTCAAMKKYFILKLDSYEGEGSSLTVDADGAGSMYVVLNVEGSSAEIVDWGYPTVDDLLAAWDNVTFENVGEFK